jgi:drug/metabolite transporter (DMT)-like permease
MFAWALYKGLPLRFALYHHRFLALQGALIFSSNFFFFYLAATHLTTGLIAVLFSTASVLTLLINSVLLRRRPATAVLSGATLGTIGIAIIFWPELHNFDLRHGSGLGLLQTFAGTLCFCLGSIVTARNHRAGLPLAGGTAWAMFYGLALLILLATLRDSPWRFEWTLAYTFSLAYLSLIGSVLAFAAYFTLLTRIEAEKAAYATVLFPVVALTLSTFFEGYQWALSGALGIILVLIGNFLVLHKKTTKANSSR